MIFYHLPSSASTSLLPNCRVVQSVLLLKLIEALVLPYLPNRQHRSPRRYVHLFRCTEIDIHIPRTSKCCNVLDVVRICEIPDSQAQSAYDAFIMSAKPRSGGSILFNIVQSRSILSFCSKFAVQRYNKICGCARKWGFFFAICWR
jgi:hypothetical protein